MNPEKLKRAGVQQFRGFLQPPSPPPMAADRYFADVRGHSKRGPGCGPGWWCEARGGDMKPGGLA